LRQDNVDPAALSGLDLVAFCAGAARHDVLPLVAERLLGLAGLPPEFDARLREASYQTAVRDMAREVELRQALSGLADGGVRALLLKGSQLAYSLYARPDLRSRIDSDILIPSAARETVRAILTERLGYVLSPKPSGELTATQALYVKWLGDVAVHAIDVHWRLASPQVFAHVLSHDEIAARAVPLPRLGPDAWGACAAHALMIACVHRVAHHADSVRLKWLYDIHLVAAHLTDGEWDDFVTLARERSVSTICRHSLDSATLWFPTAIPDRVRAALDGKGAELTAAYLTPRSKAREVADDLRALSSWRDRARLMREHLFPPAAYMRQKYAPLSTAPLPLLYLVRFCRGARKWCDPPKSAESR
jgi:hypothetical protein